MMASDDKPKQQGGQEPTRNQNQRENLREGAGHEAFKPAQYYSPDKVTRPKNDPPKGK